MRIYKRLAVKQSLAVLIIAVVLGVFSHTLQIYFDLNQEKSSATQDIEHAIHIHRETATRAIYLLDRSLGKEVTDAVISHPAIYSAVLEDDFGDTLAWSERSASSDDSFLNPIVREFFNMDDFVVTQLNVEQSANGKAKLMVKVDSLYLAGDFTRRALAGISIGLIHNMMLALLLLLFFYHYLSRPILRIVDWVNDLRNERPTKELPYAARDELGELVVNFSSLWDERKEITDQLNESVARVSRSERFSRSLMDNAGDAMFLCRPDATMVRVNQLASQALGLPQEELLDKSLPEFSSRYSTIEFVKMLEQIPTSEVLSFEDFLRNHGTAWPSTTPVESRAIKLVLDERPYYLIVARDISRRKQAEKQIHELAFYDPLTKLPNRRLFVDRLNSALQLHRANQNFGAVFYLDLDRFKTINDSLGHEIGDQLLCGISNRLRALLPEEATCARFGGDEFVIMLPESALTIELCAENAAHLAERINKKLAEPYELSGNTLYSAVSIGITFFPQEQADSADILRQADTALYRVKAKGRNNFQFYDPEMQSSAQERLQIEKGLHSAIENNELELWYQPQYNSKGQVLAAEGLIRWNHPDRGIISPGEFIQVAEDSGQIVEIGNWVLREAVKTLPILRERLPDCFERLAVNVSPLQFMQVDFVNQVFEILQEYNVPGYQLELEITENMLLNNFDIACNKMRALREHGIKFAIDDFGTGYSSLKYLQHLPLDILKIDRSFVTDINLNAEDAAIAQVIIATAEKLNLAVIAEGVETKEEQRVLAELGCHCYQGYLFAKPMPLALFLDHESVIEA